VFLASFASLAFGIVILPVQWNADLHLDGRSRRLVIKNVVKTCDLNGNQANVQRLNLAKVKRE